LLKMWLKAPVAERAEGGGWRSSGASGPRAGLPKVGWCRRCSRTSIRSAAAINTILRRSGPCCARSACRPRRPIGPRPSSLAADGFPGEALKPSGRGRPVGSHATRRPRGSLLTGRARPAYRSASPGHGAGCLGPGLSALSLGGEGGRGRSRALRHLRSYVTGTWARGGEARARGVAPGGPLPMIPGTRSTLRGAADGYLLTCRAGTNRLC
jgi:hypothetical protein